MTPEQLAHELSLARESTHRYRTKWIERGQLLNDAHDEIARLRAAMPSDVLREYDRRRRG